MNKWLDRAMGNDRAKILFNRDTEIGKKFSEKYENDEDFKNQFESNPELYIRLVLWADRHMDAAIELCEILGI